MNIKELIKKYEAVECVVGIVSGKTILKTVLKDLQQLDEPQTVKVKQFVADWIEYCKVKKITLAHALYRSEEAKNKSVYHWIFEGSGHQETFARAWLDGYEVEEEKKPMVVYKADNQGAEIFGKVVEKGRHGKLYTVTIRDYGIFVVTREQYEKIKVGDEVML